MTSSVETSNGSRMQAQAHVQPLLEQLVRELHGLGERAEAIEQRLAATAAVGERQAPARALPPARVQGPPCAHGPLALARARAARR